MKVVIETIPHAEQLYPTVGDWCTSLDGGAVFIRVSRMSDWRYEILVAIHELIEQSLCKHEGVTEKEVDDFDMSHPGSKEPGNEPDAPYRNQHEFSTAIEMLLAQRLGVDWYRYGAEVESL